LLYKETCPADSPLGRGLQAHLPMWSVGEQTENLFVCGVQPLVTALEKLWCNSIDKGPHETELG
jgi:hypothetical protein